MRNIRALVSYLSPYRSKIVIGLVLILITNALALIAPWLVKFAIDSLSQVQAKSVLLRYGLLILAIALVQGFFRFLVRWVLLAASRGAERDLRNAIFTHLMKLPLSYFNRTKTGDIMARAIGDVNSVKRLLGMGINNIFNSITMYAVAVFFMVQIDPLLTIYSLIPMPVLAIIVGKFSQSIHRRFAEVQDRYSRISEKVQENVSGIRVVKAYIQEENEVKEFERLNHDYSLKNLSLAKIESLIIPLLTFVAGVGSLIVLWLGGVKVISGQITLGDFVAFNTFLAMLVLPTMAVGQLASRLQRGSTSMGRINQILNQLPEIADDEETLAAEDMGEIKGEIEFKFRFGAHIQCFF